MLRIRQIEVDLNKKNIDEIKKKVSLKLKVKENEIRQLKINKESIDARRKPNIKFIYEVDIDIDNENKYLGIKDVLKVPNEEYKYEIIGTEKLDNIVIVGTGPAGLFAAYMLAEVGFKPLVIERGEQVEDRIKTVDKFWKDNILNINSNVQFGEGGAGTFSDGKLNTLVKDKNNRMKKVFDIFVENGANEDILYSNKPHIGTDILSIIVKNMRNKIISLGGEFRFNTCLTDIIIENNKLKGIIVNNNETIETSNLILAIGHSARDTYQMLYEKGIKMTPKDFAVGIRIMHNQSAINESQYGFKEHPNLGVASYKLTYQTKKGRGVYSFCMCPGGYVVNASSEKNKLAINGMSYHKRDSGIANSAIVVTVSKNDYGNNILDGIKFQRELEEKAYNINNGKIPIQLYKDFKNNIKSVNLENVIPKIKGEYALSNLNDIYPEFIIEALKEGIDYFGTKIKHFSDDNVIMAASETRTSSPIRIERDETFNSNIKGIYPIGEGAGYAGGITTSAMDGIKVFEEIIKIYRA